MSKGPSRRTLVASGAGLVVGAAGVRAAMTDALTPARGKAYRPWRDAESHTPGSADALVAHAILAASPHNTQPWRFRRAGSGLGLTADLARNLGAFDPYLREMHIGIGAAIENLVIAASTQRRIVRVRFDARDLAAIKEREGPGPLIALDISEADTVADSLAAQIPKRHTNRGPYRLDAEARHLLADAVREAAIDQSQCRVVMIEDETRARQFDDLVIESTARIVSDAQMVKDSDRWFRKQGEIGKYRDGLTLDAAGLSPILAAFAKMMPPLSAQSTHEFWLRSTRAALATTPRCAASSSCPRSTISAPASPPGAPGSASTSRRPRAALALQPVNQPIEIVDREAVLGQEAAMARRIAALADAGGWRPTFAFRAGFPEHSVPPSPRRPVSAVMDG